MTLSSTLIRAQYNGDGTTITFTIPFVFWNDNDITVILTDASGDDTDWVRGTQFTVTGGDGDTGTLTAITSPTDYTPASGEKLTILSSLPNIQDLSLPLGGPLPSDNLERELDQIVRMIQQLVEKISRAILLAESSTYSDITFPDPEAGKLIRWKADLTGFENIDAAGSGLTLPLSIADGGTGATTGFAALTNLGLKRAASRITLWRLGQF